MLSIRRSLISVGLVAASCAAATAAAPFAAAGAPNPVIGAPVTRPATQQAGKPFVVTYKVVRSDSRKPLTSGTMVCDPSVDGSVLKHTESFRHGTARLSFLIPAAAQGRAVKVRLTIRFNGRSANRISTFRIPSLPKPSLTVGDATVVEGNSATVALVFPVTLSAPTPLGVTASYATSDATATAGSDYAAASGTVKFRPGESTRSITVTVNGDVSVEPDETLTVTLSNVVNATIGDGQALGTITNDDIAARSGHYTGSTSQWQFIAFDVSSGATGVSGLFFFVDLTCDTPLNSLKGVKLALDPFPLDPDGTFAVDASGVVDQVSIHLLLSGRVTAPGSAAGTLRVVDITSNQPPYRGAHCWTSDVSWNAS